MLSYKLRSVLEEIIEPGGGDEPDTEIIDPNSPQNKTRKNKIKYRPHAVRMQLYGAGRRKMWMPGGGIV